MESASPIADLDELLRQLSPELDPDTYVFCSVDDASWDVVKDRALAMFREDEGTSVVLRLGDASALGLGFQGTFRRITLRVHSSLTAVGLTAAVASKLASRDVSANVIAANYHDHIFVPSDTATRAMVALDEFRISVPAARD